MSLRRRPLSGALLFFIFAIVFSLTIWPDVSLSAKIGFFAAGAGCGVGIGRSAKRR